MTGGLLTDDGRADAVDSDGAVGGVWVDDYCADTGCAYIKVAGIRVVGNNCHGVDQGVVFAGYGIAGVIR